MSSRLKKVRVVLLALVCLAGCTSELARQETADRQRSEVARQEEWLAWSKAMNTWDPNVGKEFLGRYPDSVYRLRVQEHIDELHAKAKDRPTYEPYVQKNTIEGYREFLAQYPHNAFVPEAQAQIAELEYAPYRNLNTVSSYEQFLVRYPNHKYTQDAKERMAALREPPQSVRASTSHPSEVVVTTGPLSQPYEALGEVHVNTVGEIYLGSLLNDTLFRSPLARSIQATPATNTVTMNEKLRQEARSHYGGRVDAVVNVSYRTDPDGDMFASGLAVHFIEPQPASALTAPAPTLEQKLTELKSLREKNLITPEEYYEKRSELLKGL